MLLDRWEERRENREIGGGLLHLFASRKVPNRACITSPEGNDKPLQEVGVGFWAGVIHRDVRYITLGDVFDNADARVGHGAKRFKDKWSEGECAGARVLLAVLLDFCCFALPCIGQGGWTCAVRGEWVRDTDVDGQRGFVLAEACDEDVGLDVLVAVQVDRLELWAVAGEFAAAFECVEDVGVSGVVGVVAAVREDVAVLRIEGLAARWAFGAKWN